MWITVYTIHVFTLYVSYLLFCSILGEMLLHLDSLNSRLCSASVSCSSSLRAPASDSAPFGCYDYLSIYHPEEHTAMMELLASVEKGHMTVMWYDYNNFNYNIFRWWGVWSVCLTDQSDAVAEWTSSHIRLWYSLLSTKAEAIQSASAKG